MFGASSGSFPLEQHVEHVINASKNIPHSQGTIWLGYIQLTPDTHPGETCLSMR